MIYYIADMHFGHENVIHFDDRPFADTEQMDEVLIQNWNERVTSEDTVYVLGDAFWKNEENSIRIIQQLNGHKHLIQGNHDRVKGKLRPYWESIEQYAEVNDENRLVILSHYPILFYKNQHYGAVMAGGGHLSRKAAGFSAVLGHHPRGVGKPQCGQIHLLGERPLHGDDMRGF